MAWTQKDLDKALAKNPRVKVLSQTALKKPSAKVKPDEYKSAGERAFSTSGYLALLADLPAGTSIAQMYYEPKKFAIDGGGYTPDFLFLTDAGERLFVEVKGSKHQKNYRSARCKLRAAAERYFFFRWFEATRVGGQWRIEEIVSKKRKLKLLSPQARIALKNRMRELAIDGAGVGITMPKTIIDLVEFIDLLEEQIAGY